MYDTYFGQFDNNYVSHKRVCKIFSEIVHVHLLEEVDQLIFNQRKFTNNLIKNTIRNRKIICTLGFSITIVYHRKIAFEYVLVRFELKLNNMYEPRNYCIKFISHLLGLSI